MEQQKYYQPKNQMETVKKIQANPKPKSGKNLK